VPSRLEDFRPPAISANLGGCNVENIDERLFRVVLCDPITGEEFRTLGLFYESYAVEFLAEWRRLTANDRGELRVVKTVPVKIQYRELAA
jgi:hypothetical protein